MKSDTDQYWLQENELREVLEIIKSGNIVHGPEVEGFEKEFARYIGAQHTVAVSSGTAGLHVALQVLNKEKSGKIITTPHSFIATANSILYVGAKPIFVDTDSSMNIDPIQVEKNFSSQTNGVLAVHLYGLPFKINQIMKTCKKNNAFLVEDCAQALGSTYDGKHVGTFGAAGVFSFYDTKHLKLGEGGMIVTNKKDVAEKCRMVRSHGMTSQYVHQYLGYNYRMNEVFAKIGKIQLKKIKKLVNARRERGKIYLEDLRNVNGLLSPSIPENIQHSFYRFPIIMKTKYSQRKDLISTIRKKIGIELSTGYPSPIYKQPLYQQISKKFWAARVSSFPKYSKLRCKNAEQAIRSLIELPTDPWISEDKIMKISNAFKLAFKEI
ncbi:MAG: DegT/DnrJ/EryC1/StrS family aminotransferase [Nitrosopumilaceae archaeon]